MSTTSIFCCTMMHDNFDCSIPLPTPHKSPQTGHPLSVWCYIHSQAPPRGCVRTSCLDDVPTCGRICAQPLPCSRDGEQTDKQTDRSTSLFLLGEIHTCKHKCHHGECPPCEGVTVAVCRCGNSKEEPCVEVEEKEGFTCNRMCNRKLSCGHHRCNKKCCCVRDVYWCVLCVEYIWALAIGGEP